MSQNRVKRMVIVFQMIEIDENDEAVNTVTTQCEFDDGATHPEVTRRYNDFLRGCGYIWGVNDKILFCRYNPVTRDLEPQVDDE